MLNLLKKFLFATYISDKKLFKIRNRTFLGLFVLFLIHLFMPSEDILFQNNFVAAATEYKQESLTEENKVPVNIEEIKQILNGNKQSEQQQYIDNKNGSYIILLLTTKKSENTDSFRDKYSGVDIKESINKDSKILFVGPFEGYSLAKKELSNLKDLLPVDSYIIKFVN